MKLNEGIFQDFFFHVNKQSYVLHRIWGMIAFTPNT
jgi:hypothetical protein